MSHFTRLSIRSKITAALLLVSLISIGLSGYISWRRSRTEMQHALTNKLVALRELEMQEIEFYFDVLSDHTVSLAEDRMVIDAFKAFRIGFKSLENIPIEEEQEAAVEQFYVEQFLPLLRERVDGEPALEVYRPSTRPTNYLQYHYIADNPNPLNERHLLDTISDSTGYAETHGFYHPIFRSIVERFGYYDMFLIDIQTGDLVYTTFKETDFATNIDDGPYQRSNLAQLVNDVRANPDRNTSSIVDFQHYRPSLMQPAAFIGAPIYDGERLLGVLAFQLPIDRINHITTLGGQWEESGLGETGEIFIFSGDDMLMRTKSRQLIEDRDAFIAAQRSLGVRPDMIDQMRLTDTTVLALELRSDAAQEAADGRNGVQTITNYRGELALSAYAPLDIPGLNWAVVTEIETAEMFAPVETLTREMLILSAVLIAMISFAALLFAGSMTKPIRHIATFADALSHGELDEQLEMESNDEIGELGQSLQAVQATLKTRNQQLGETQSALTQLKTRLIPARELQRSERGQTATTDSVPQSAAIVADLRVGNGTLENFREIQQSVEVLAQQNDIELLALTPQHIVAVSGLSVARLDYLQRAVSFAVALTRSMNTIEAQNHSAHIGVATGELRGGVINAKKLIYGVWGKPVDDARQLASVAEVNEVLVSAEVADLLDTQYDIIPSERDGVAAWRIERTLMTRLGVTT